MVEAFNRLFQAFLPVNCVGALLERVSDPAIPSKPHEALIAEGFRNWLLPLVLLICGSILTLVTGIALLRLMKRATG